MTLIWTFLIYWLVLFVGCYVVCEIGQDQLYDEVTPRVGLKVLLGSFLLGLMLTYFQPSYESMFTTNIAWTILQGIVWFGVFTLIYQFHPWHALGLGILTMLLVSGLATMGVDSLMKPTPATVSRPASAMSNTPVRQSVAPPAAVAQPKNEAVKKK
jgi:hypothetical protein